MSNSPGPRSVRRTALLLSPILVCLGCDGGGPPPPAPPSDGGVGVLGAPVAMDDDPVVVRFRNEAGAYLEMRAALNELNRRLATGEASTEEVERWRTLQQECDQERLRLNRILYADSIDPERRRAMFWILQSAN